MNSLKTKKNLFAVFARTIVFFVSYLNHFNIVCFTPYAWFAIFVVKSTNTNLAKVMERKECYCVPVVMKKPLSAKLIASKTKPTKHLNQNVSSNILMSFRFFFSKILCVLCMALFSKIQEVRNSKLYAFF